MLYELTSNADHVRIIEGPAHRRGALPIALTVWIGEVWLPSLIAPRGARITHADVCHIEPTKLWRGGVAAMGKTSHVARVYRPSGGDQ